MPFTVPACVVTVSDRCSRGAAEDRSGPLAAELVAAALPGATVARALVPDGADSVRAAIVGALRDGARLVVTTGGTGVGPRDRTPEGTAGLLDREIPGIAEQIRSRGATVTPHAVLSRGLVGVVDPGPLSAEGAIIVNLPGSTGGVRDGSEVVLPLVEHVLDQIVGGDH